jgi:hypothetical protein
MPKKSTGSIADIVSQFVEQLTSAIEMEALGRARDAVLSAVGGGGGAMVARGPGRPAGIRRGPGRPPGRPRKKPPIQYCPVPGCKNRAAPVFGMVCGEHRNVSKALIKKYRAQRKAEKSKAKVAGRRGRAPKSPRAASQEAAA